MGNQSPESLIHAIMATALQGQGEACMESVVEIAAAPGSRRSPGLRGVCLQHEYGDWVRKHPKESFQPRFMEAVAPTGVWNPPEDQSAQSKEWVYGNLLKSGFHKVQQINENNAEIGLQKEKYRSTKSRNRRTLAVLLCQAVGGPRPAAVCKHRCHLSAPHSSSASSGGPAQPRPASAGASLQPQARGLAGSSGQGPQPCLPPAQPCLWSTSALGLQLRVGQCPGMAWAQPCGLAFYPGLAQEHEPGHVSQTQLLSLSAGQALPSWRFLWAQLPSCSPSWMQELLHALSFHSRNAALRKDRGFSL